MGGTPALDKSTDFEHADTVFERDRNHVAGSHYAAWRINPRTVHPDMTGSGERRRGAARGHDASVPQPFVDALAVGLGCRLHRLVEQDLRESRLPLFRIMR